MVTKTTVGILGIQGAVSEHVTAVEKALEASNKPGTALVVKHYSDIDTVDALILPGGESTHMSKLLDKTGIHSAILERIQKNDLPIMGTCAGCVLLAKKLTKEDNDIHLLHAMDMTVTRNAFGRQKESFERPIRIDGFSKPYHAVFIRAPLIDAVESTTKVLASIDKKIIMARQGKFLALSFHPELTNDLRIHSLFLTMI